MSGTDFDCSMYSHPEEEEYPDDSLQESNISMVLPATRPDYNAAQFRMVYGQEGSSIAGQFRFPEHLAVSPRTGDIAVTDQVNHRIHIYQSTLLPVSIFGREGDRENLYRFPEGVTFNDEGSVFVSDWKNHRIQVTDGNGHFLYGFGSKGYGQNNFKYPRGIASVGDLLYICDSENYRIKIVKEDGSYVKEFGSKGFGYGQFYMSPWFIAASAIHNKVVISDVNGNLYYFTLSGEFIKMFQALERPLYLNASGVAIDAYGSVLVADWSSGSVVVLDQDDDIVARIGTQGDEPGELDRPCGIAVTHDGELAVCDYWNHRIQIFHVPWVIA